MANNLIIRHLGVLLFLLLVSTSPTLQAQCLPDVSTWVDALDVFDLGQVTIQGVTRNSNCNTTTTAPGSWKNRYGNYTNMGSLCSVDAGEYATFSATTKNCYDFFVHACTSPSFRSTNTVAIDWNHDGDFDDPGERIHKSITDEEATFQGSFFVPLDAVAGLTLVRFSSLSEAVSLNIPPCTNFYYLRQLDESPNVQPCYFVHAGEVEDHYISVNPHPACSGQPPAGQAASTQQNVCESGFFTVYVNGVPHQDGYQYQWQSSLDGIYYQNIPGATNYNLRTNQAGTTHYRRITACPNSGQQQFSNAVTVVSRPFTECYCVTENLLLNPSGDIVKVQIGDAVKLSSCTPDHFYSNYRSLGTFAAITPGEATPFEVHAEGSCEPGDDFTYKVAIFADLNQDGSFEGEAERLYYSTQGFLPPHQFLGTFTIPASAQPGVTGLRMIYNYTLAEGANPMDACNYTYGGEREDYLIEILPCPGVPALGGQIDPAGAVCPGDSFTLKVLCATEYHDNLYEWYVSDDGYNWDQIPGANRAAFQGVQATTRYYRRKTIRYLSGAVSLSNAVQVELKPFYQCYCLPDPQPVANSTKITTVTIFRDGASQADGYHGSSCNDPLHPFNLKNYDHVFANLKQGTAYWLGIEICGDAKPIRAWIDFNRDGSFGAGEVIAFNGYLNFPQEFTIPNSVAIGLTGMRIELYDSDNPNLDCSGVLKAEVEDYVVNIVGCSGTPAGGTAIAIPDPMVCQGETVTLRITGGSPPEQLLQYQWQKKDNNGNWIDISGATDSILQVTYTGSAPTSYRRRSACLSNAAHAFSDAVVLNLDIPTNCYCAASATSPDGMDIVYMVFDAVAKLSDCSATGGGQSVLRRYSDYRGQGSIDQISLGQSVSFEVGTLQCNWADHNSLAVCLDFNGNGSFNDPGEIVYQSDLRYGAQVYTGAFTVPMNARTGLIGLRLVCSNSVGAAPCGTYITGETEDYLVTITGCSGAPNPGVTQASVSSFCSLAPDVVFSVTGDSPAEPGLSYQWQAAADGSTWENIPGATQAGLTTNVTASYYFRRRIHCSSGNAEAFSTPVFVEKSRFACYCSSAANSAASADISTISINGVEHSQSCSDPAGVGSLPGRYTNNKNLGPIFQLNAGTTNTFAIGVGPCDNTPASIGWAAFIDYNQNGSFFDPGEMVLYNGTGTTAVPYGQQRSLAVPGTALEGITLLRVIAADQPGNTIQACGTYNIGETVDYLVNIEPICPGNIVFVDADATGANNGKSWTNAFTNLQDALALANTCPDISEVWVAEGIYKPTTGSDQTQSFALQNGLALYGGFVGTETSRDQRNFRAHPTILSGNIGNQASQTDNSRHVVVSNGNDPTAILDGFVVRDGYADDIGDNRGAGLYITNAAPVIRNCVVRDNAVRFASSTDIGAAMCLYNASCQVESCIFTNNSAQSLQSGNIYMGGSGQSVFSNCLIAANAAGMFASGNADVTLVNCTLADNLSSGLTALNANITATNCIIRGNGIQVIQGAAPVITYSITPGVYSGVGNLNAEPLFANAADPDGADNIFGTSDDGYALQACSPAIDGGTTAGAPAVDLSGNATPFNATGANTVDMGPYEYRSVLTAPTINCPSSRTVSATTNIPCTAVLNDIHAGYSTPCPATALSYTLSGATTGSGNGQASGQVFQTGSTTVTYTVSNGVGPTASCTFVVTVNPCQVTLSGVIHWKQDNTTGVKDATVTVTGDRSGTTTTAANGTYALTLDPGSNFTITPTKTANKLNGVNTQDVLRIQQHLSGNPITSPWQLIAADVNGNNQVTSLDANILQLAILGNPSAMAQFVHSWRFIPKSYALPNSPWGFPENITLSGAAGTINNLDFWGVKVGDVAAAYANPANSNAESLVLRAPDQMLQAGREMTVLVSGSALRSLSALQFALRFDPEYLQFMDVHPLGGLPLRNEHFGLWQTENGSIRCAWSDVQAGSLKAGAGLFQLHFIAREGGVSLREVLQLDDATLPGMVFNGDGQSAAVQLRFDGLTAAPTVQDNGVLTLQNYPNPFSGRTTVRFELAEACHATLRIIDAAGRIVAQRQQHCIGGVNEVTFTLDTAPGVLYCELITPRGVLTRKMVATRE